MTSPISSMMKRAAVLLFSAAISLGATACKKKEGEPAAGGSGSAAATSGGDKGGNADKVAGDKAAGKELADAAEATGITWKRTDVPFGSVELPGGEGWSFPDATQAEGPDGV